MKKIILSRKIREVGIFFNLNVLKDKRSRNWVGGGFLNSKKKISIITRMVEVGVILIYNLTPVQSTLARPYRNNTKYQQLMQI